MNKLSIVLDTNVLLVSISSKSKYHWIFQALLNEKYNLFITNEIVTEYEEIITLKYNAQVAEQVLKTLLLLPNVHTTIIYYHWYLIKDDEDDNKFTDCAITSNAHYLVTQDKHFNILKTQQFPKINVISIAKFHTLIECL
jgi:putative PIN family toxin of toxin-antitoxin system